MVNNLILIHVYGIIYNGWKWRVIMAITIRNNIKDFGFILGTLNDYVPEDHLVRKLEEAIDWCFIYPLVKPLYSLYGRPSIDPVILFKMIFINYVFGINSMRKTCKEIKVNLAYRWFLGISLEEEVPNYSTWSKNYIRRYHDSNVFDQIFERIIEQGLRYGFINTETVFADSTHQKASANKRKHERKEVELTKKKFEDELLEEINEDRKAHGKKKIDHLDREEYDFDEMTGEQVIVSKKKEVKASITDPEAGNYHKGEHEECFAYSHQAFCDTNGFILCFETVPGNVHDSVSFFDAYEKLNRRYKVKNIVLDAGYKTPAIAKEVSDHNQLLYLPYTRPKGNKKGGFSRKDFEFDKENDKYICPGGETLSYSTTDRKGYRIYKSDPKKCKNCPSLDKCTSSKNHQKTLARHLWQDYLNECEKRRYTEEWKNIYPLRKETIERDFGDCKENHCLRYTRIRGLNKNSHQAAIIFTSHNLKKLSIWRSKYKDYYDSIDRREENKKEEDSLSLPFHKHFLYFS